MKKALLGILIVLGLSAPLAAYAADTQLSWERSQMQTLEVDQIISQDVMQLALIGEGKELQFSRSSTKTRSNRDLYQALIPTSFPLGTYVVRGEMADGSSKDFALIKIVEFQSENYNPLTDTATVTTLSVTLFTLLAIWGLADTPPGRREEFEQDQTTFDGADGGLLGRGAGDKRNYRKGLVSSLYLDQMRSVSTITSNRISPLISRLISDSGYLQFSLGSLVLIFPVIGALLGALAFKDIQGIGGITTPSLSISLAIIVLGTFDASAGAIAALTFGICALTSQRFGNIYDVRTFLGLSILFFSPALIANATRALRKSRKDSDAWERLTDVVVGSVLTGWAIRCMVIGLDGFAHLKLPLGQHANQIGTVIGACIALRYVIEGYVNQKNHYYLAYLSPRLLNEQDSNFKIVGWFVKGSLFLFFAVSFLGLSWQLWAALCFLMVPQLIKVVKDQFPNSSLLFQILPVGVPALVFMTFLGKFYSQFTHSLDLDPATASRTIFVLASIPGFIIGFLKFFGREPKPGDKRWYLRPQNAILYKVGGVSLFAFYLSLTFGLVG
jgi:hypothetical protein